MNETLSKWIYKAGGFSLIIVGISYLIGAALSLIIGPAPSGTIDYMNALASHKLISLINFAFFTLADVFLIPAAICLYYMLKSINKKAITIASLLIIVFAVFDAGITEFASVQLVVLTQNFSAATNDAQRTAIMLTANSLLSTLPISTLCSFVISSVGLLITAIVMKKASFPRLSTLPGVTAGIGGTLGGFYIVVPAFAVLMVPSMFAMGVWGIFAGREVRKYN
jgi:hypothetical protein